MDNAKVYHAKRLKAACIKLNIHPYHRTKGDPPPGGLVEKIIQTIQNRFEAEVPRHGVVFVRMFSVNRS